MATRFKPNPLFAAQLKAGAAYRAVLEHAADEIKRNAERIAGNPADYKAAVETDGPAVRVVVHDPWGHLEEFGSVNNPPKAPLRRGVRAAGLRLREAPKP